MKAAKKFSILQSEFNIFYNFWLKLIALILAVLTWFYVAGELSKTTLLEESSAGAFPFMIMMSNFPVEPVFSGRPPAGYEIDRAKVEVEPRTYKVTGSSRIIEKLRSLKTDPIDVSEYTKPFIVKAGFQKVPGIKLPSEDFIKVKVPIIKQQE